MYGMQTVARVMEAYIHILYTYCLTALPNTITKWTMTNYYTKSAK